MDETCARIRGSWHFTYRAIRFMFFPLNPALAIENCTAIRSRTENRQGIGGNLDDQQIARRIYEALFACPSRSLRP